MSLLYRVSRGRLGLVLLAGCLLVAASGIAELVVQHAGGATPTPGLPLNDIQPVLGKVIGGQTPATAPVQDPAQPALEPTPAADCGPGSNPLSGEQGRVTAAQLFSSQGANGYTCNLSLVSHRGASGGYKVWRYVDDAGHVCAFYDTALIYPINAVSLSGPASTGVVVLNMADPAHPVQTDTLTSLPMLSPHESLNLNYKRGLLAADLGNPATYPGLMSIYDVSHDCLHPTLDSTYLAARFGHESGFSPDGRTFWISGAFEGLAAVDVSDPTHPKTIWQGNEWVHGLSLSDDGDTAYAADPVNGDLTMLDVSQIQNRVADPQVSEISRLTWDTVSIPQNAYAMQINGHPYLLEFDEFAFRFNPPSENNVGAARVIDIADPAHPHVVSNIRLAVNQPAAHAAATLDPQPFNAPMLGYSAHYCSLPREVDPEIVACSFTNSGLRVFNIQDPAHPREVAYYVAPANRTLTNGLTGSNFAMSKPAFDPATREVYYTDAASGFYVLKLAPSAWPDPTMPPATAGSGAGTGSGSATVPADLCPAATGSLTASRIGPIRLGERRARVARAFGSAYRHAQSHADAFCLSHGSIRALYGHGAQLTGLTKAARRRLVGHVVLVLTDDSAYTAHSIRPGATLAAARRRLALGRGYRIGRNTWYVAHSGRRILVLRAQRGRVAEVGIAAPALTTGRAATRRLLSHLT